MVDPRGEVDLGWLEWVISREMDVQEEDTAGVWGVIWSHNGCLPVILILLVNWTSRAVGGGVIPKVLQFPIDAFQSHDDRAW